MKNSSACYLKSNRIRLLYTIGILSLVAAALLGIGLGSTPITMQDITALFHNGVKETAAGRILLYVRLPRTAASLLCGAALAVSGAVIQGVLANRLASPSILGVNAGAGLAVTACTAAGLYGGFTVSLAAFAGAFFTVTAVALCAKKWGVSRGTLILIGVAFNSLLGAVSDSIITFVPEVGVMSNDFKMGDFSAVTLQKLIPAACLILPALILVFSLSNELDVLSLGEEHATGLGLKTPQVRMLFLLLVALLAGCAVSLAGLLSFVGLLVPHAVRRLAGNNTTHLLPLCALYGGAFVCVCDTVSRTVFSPYEIPVGIIMAFLGAPFFLFILIKGKGGHGRD